MQRYDFYLILPNFYTLFCYPEITFYTVDAHTGRKLTIPYTIERYLTNLKVRLSGLQPAFWCFLPPPDASETASRRSDGYVPTQWQTRRDVATAASGRSLKVKGLWGDNKSNKSNRCLWWKNVNVNVNLKCKWRKKNACNDIISFNSNIIRYARTYN